MRKVPHYYFPSATAWNSNVVNAPHTIQEHVLHLQRTALRRCLFTKLPRKTTPELGEGLIPLLERIAIYPDESSRWATSNRGAEVIGSVLVVHDLKTCAYVSAEGRRWYKKERGCILVPFVAHDGRLVGHGLVVYDRPLIGEGLQQLVHGWKVLFDVTFGSLIANLNSAALSALDGFFLGRVRELRHIMGGRESASRKRAAVPSRDAFVLNKIALYELVGSRLDRPRDKFRLVFFDLDGFKNVNDTIGHQAADVLLFHVAEQLVDLFTPTKNRWLCRFGGDEFVGIVPFNDELPLSELSKRIALAIRKAQKEYNDLANPRRRYLVELTTSMGWVTSRDLRNLGTAGGLEAVRRRLLNSMRDAYALVELADADTQERVKELGKHGWLEFEKRRKLASDKESMCRELWQWVKVINWLGPRSKKRQPRVGLLFRPPRS